MSLFKLDSFLVEKIWGADRLAGLKGMGRRTIGEFWQVSTLPEGSSRIADTDIELRDKVSELPYLIKFIDTSDNLSVQVHPNDDFANKYENSKGKTECWIILDADEGSGIYLGLRPNVSKDQFSKALHSKENLSELLNFYPVKAGDFFYVPAGTIHAIGKGISLAEIQQSSGITYRVWDWNRVDKNGNARELHIDKALACINFDNSANVIENFKHKKEVFAVQKDSKEVDLIKHPDFNVKLFSISSGEKIQVDLPSRNRPSSLTCLFGSVEIQQGEDSLSLDFLNSVINYDGADEVKVSAREDSIFFTTTVDKV